MQRTRLNNLLDNLGNKISLLFGNPWRRIALSIISLLSGFFMGSALITTAGQDAAWDVTGAAMLFGFTEIISKFVYSRKADFPNKRRSLFIDVLNLFKIGVTYSLFLEAFKLGS